MSAGKLPSFEEAAAIKAQQRVDEVTKALFYHFNKHHLHPLEIAYVLAGSYLMVLDQLPEEGKKPFAEQFEKLIKPEPEAVIIVPSADKK